MDESEKLKLIKNVKKIFYQLAKDVIDDGTTDCIDLKILQMVMRMSALLSPYGVTMEELFTGFRGDVAKLAEKINTVIDGPLLIESMKADIDTLIAECDK